jgi:hypothetical protein
MFIHINPQKNMNALFFLLFLFSTPVIAQGVDSLNVEEINDSRLTIRGTTNIAGFTCKLEQEFENDTLRIPGVFLDSLIHLRNTRLEVESNRFDCGVPKVTRDFHKTLKAGTHPFINLNYTEIIYETNQRGILNDLQISTQVEITIAEISHEYDVIFKFAEIRDNILTFIGRQPIDIKAFNLTPPSALFGLLKVNEQVDVDFFLHLRSN